MCAICGIVHVDGNRSVDTDHLARMARSMRHRGPDSEGFFVKDGVGLGHQRLKIVDLSDGGGQPMSDDSGRYHLVFNGEIYNHVEIRRELESRGHTFRSNSDTEVLLKLYVEKGPRCVDDLNGMFAFAVWDGAERCLFAARDRFGIKPFYYTFDGRIFAFASETKALLAAGVAQRRLDRDGLADYLTFQFTLGAKTLFSGVERLEPAHLLHLTATGDLNIRRYWEASFEVDTHHTEEYFAQRLRELLEDAVRLQLRADVPVGAHLSGGLDSSTIVALAAAQHPEALHTFTGAFDEGAAYDETAYARLVAEQAQTVHHEIFPGPDDFVELLPELVYRMDEPAAGPGLLPQYAVSKAAAEHVKVVLGGQGGDEIFGGYTRYLIAYLEECLRGGIEGTHQDARYVVTFESILPNLQQLQGYEPLMRHFFSDGLFAPPAQRYFRLIDRSASVRPLVRDDLLSSSYSPFASFESIFEAGGVASYINRMTRFDMQTMLPALLHVEDRTSMAVSLESRVPLLDHRIVELVASMPPRIKYEGGRAKHIFRQVTADLLPPAVRERKDKMGFPVPLTRWYQQRRVRDFVVDTLLSRRARERGWFDASNVESLLSGERAYGRSVWGLLNLELWAQTFLDAGSTATSAQNTHTDPLRGAGRLRLAS